MPDNCSHFVLISLQVIRAGSFWRKYETPGMKKKVRKGCLQKTDAGGGQMPLIPNRAVAEGQHSTCLLPDRGHDGFPGQETSPWRQKKAAPTQGQGLPQGAPVTGGKEAGDGPAALPAPAPWRLLEPGPGPGPGRAGGLRAGGLGAGGLRAGGLWAGQGRASRSRLINEANAEQTERWWRPVSCLPSGACELLPGWRARRGQKTAELVDFFCEGLACRQDQAGRVLLWSHVVAGCLVAVSRRAVVHFHLPGEAQSPGPTT